jgi:hypothetical protein
MATLDHIILNGRPGGGKSELIDFLKRQTPAQRRERFHVGEFAEIDDFPWLWDKFVEDDLWEELGEARRFSRRVPGGYVQLEGDQLLDMLMRKFNAVIGREFLSEPAFYDDGTVIIEFARGVADGGFRHAYQQLSEAVLSRAAILYIQVTYAESQRRNDARFEEALAHSVLAHRVPEEGLIRFSAEHDWLELTDGRDSGYLEVKGLQVPFVTMNNEPELKDDGALSDRYGRALSTLYGLYADKR